LRKSFVRKIREVGGTHLGDGEMHDALHVLGEVGDDGEETPVVSDLSDDQAPERSTPQDATPGRPWEILKKQNSTINKVRRFRLVDASMT
jgi:hypothetical protein